jgi:hypothetical protein
MPSIENNAKAWVLALLMLGAVSLAGPTEAAAKKSVKPEGPVIAVPASSSLAPSGTAMALAACPPGTGVVGGGFSSQPTPGTDPGAMVIESRAAGNAWLATAVENSSSPGIVSTEAYCRRNAPALTVATGVAPLQAATASAYGTGTATAECPAGYSAVAGGFAGPFGLTPARFVVTSASRRSADGRGWQVRGANLLGAPDSITAYAYCAKAHTTEISSALVSGSGRGAPIVADAQPCPRVKVKIHRHGKTKKARRATQALSGGFALSDIARAGNYGPLVFNSNRTPTGWHTGANELNGGTGTATGFAYCGL